MSTLVIMCADHRLFERTVQLHVQYKEQDGQGPYCVRLAGAALPLKYPQVLSVAVRDFIAMGVRHIHLENHMGLDGTSGCAAFGAMAKRERLDPSAEHPQHWSLLDDAAADLRKFITRSTSEVGLVTTGIYHHDDKGFGHFEPRS